MKRFSGNQISIPHAEMLRLRQEGKWYKDLTPEDKEKIDSSTSRSLLLLYYYYYYY